MTYKWFVHNCALITIHSLLRNKWGKLTSEVENSDEPKDRQSVWEYYWSEAECNVLKGFLLLWLINVDDKDPYCFSAHIDIVHQLLIRLNKACCCNLLCLQCWTPAYPALWSGYFFVLMLRYFCSVFGYYNRPHRLWIWYAYS